MSDINFRIKILVDHFADGNNSVFAKLIDVNEANVRGYLAGVEPKFNVIQKICKALEIYPEWLILGEGEMEKRLNVIAENKSSYNLPKVITVDSHKNENITLVSVKARAGYLDGYYKSDFIKTLPTYRMPGLDNGTFRAFQVRGQSMNQSSLHDKCYAIGEWVENWITDIKDDRIYIVVHEDWDSDREGVLIKRCLNRIDKYNNLLCKSDNLDRGSYPNINISPTTIKEVWEVKGALIFEFPNPALIFERMNELEADVSEIKRKLLN